MTSLSFEVQPLLPFLLLLLVLSNSFNFTVSCVLRDGDIWIMQRALSREEAGWQATSFPYLLISIRESGSQAGQLRSVPKWAFGILYFHLFFKLKIYENYIYIF